VHACVCVCGIVARGATLGARDFAGYAHPPDPPECGVGTLCGDGNYSYTVNNCGNTCSNGTEPTENGNVSNYNCWSCLLWRIVRGAFACATICRCPRQQELDMPLPSVTVCLSPALLRVS
jgi:hypothetical protein